VYKKINENARNNLSKFNIEEQWALKVSQTDISSTDLHIHIIDSISVTCNKCGSKNMKRTSEVLDCWFESGSMPYAQSHYPFENRKTFESNFPADFIAEGIDQTRGWFYTLTVLGSAVFKRESFKNVIVNGIILAEDGKKLSKRLRNYVQPEVILDKLGADALRLFLINSPAVKAEDLCFSEKGVSEMARAILLPFWNAYSFFVTYANVDNWTPDPSARPSSDNELDRWIVSLLNHVISSVNKEMEQYCLYRVVPLLVDYIDNLTNWYIRRSRRRFWKSENDTDKVNAYATLYFVLVEFSKLMAPFLPFLTEAIYRNLVAGGDKDLPESVHLNTYPQSNEDLVDLDLEERMSLVRQVVSMSRLLRSKYNIKIRQPLSTLSVVIKNDHKRNMVSEMEGLIKDELNVKSIVFDSNEDSLVEISAIPNYRNLGRIYGPRMNSAKKEIESLSKEDIRRLETGDSMEVLGHTITFNDLEIRRTKHEGVEVETQGEITVALNTEITEELKNEGYAREFINRIQNIRKSMNFNVTDRIHVKCLCDEILKNALMENEEFICTETLSTKIVWSIIEENDEKHGVNIDGFDVEIVIRTTRP
jgi:isoleucyl-tRNA synthetase